MNHRLTLLFLFGICCVASTNTILSLVSTGGHDKRGEAEPSEVSPVPTPKPGLKKNFHQAGDETAAEVVATNTPAQEIRFIKENVADVSRSVRLWKIEQEQARAAEQQEDEEATTYGWKIGANQKEEEKPGPTATKEEQSVIYGWEFEKEGPQSPEEEHRIWKIENEKPTSAVATSNLDEGDDNAAESASKGWGAVVVLLTIMMSTTVLLCLRYHASKQKREHDKLACMKQSVDVFGYLNRLNSEKSEKMTMKPSQLGGFHVTFTASTSSETEQDDSSFSRLSSPSICSDAEGTRRNASSAALSCDEDAITDGGISNAQSSYLHPPDGDSGNNRNSNITCKCDSLNVTCKGDSNGDTESEHSCHDNISNEEEAVMIELSTQSFDSMEQQQQDDDFDMLDGDSSNDVESGIGNPNRKTDEEQWEVVDDDCFDENHDNTRIIHA